MRNYFPVKKIMIIIPALFLIAWMDPFNDEVEKGNDNYNNNKPAEALMNYKNAEKYSPDETKKSKLDFNKGDAEFRLNNHDSAIARYKNSLNSGDPDVQKKALYNIGNTYMKMGKKKEAAESYIKALQIDPSYGKAKKNLEYLLKKQEQEKQQNNSGQNGNKSDSGGESKNDGSKKSENDKKNNAQMQNLMESMKNKPVRKQKGSGNGKRYLEKFW